jgi:hypothetical protein
MLSHYKYEHGENEWDEIIMKLQDDLAYLELENKDIANAYSVDNASEPRWE